MYKNCLIKIIDRADKNNDKYWWIATVWYKNKTGYNLTITCGDGGIDVKENKIIGYKSVEINGFWGFRRNPKSHFSIWKIPCGNRSSVDYCRVCRHYVYFGGSEQNI